MSEARTPEKKKPSRGLGPDKDVSVEDEYQSGDLELT
jgi:hypothetical protein